MVAPKAETIFTFGQRKVVGIVLLCPVCDIASPLRCETPKDYPVGEVPDLVGNAGPLGFVARCDVCGFRVEMHGDRLPPVRMMQTNTRCPGSGRSPDRRPEHGEHGRRPCPACGQSVRLFTRRYDSSGPDGIMFADHDALAAE